MSRNFSSTPQQAILQHYRNWLADTARQRSHFNGVLFAIHCTTASHERFLGLSVDEICHAVGADAAMDTGASGARGG